jgi:hypothetical protein
MYCRPNDFLTVFAVAGEPATFLLFAENTCFADALIVK